MLAAGRLLSRRCRSGFGFAEAVAAEQEDLGVLDQPIHDGRGDGGVVEDVAPFGKCGIGGDKSRTFLAMAGGDDLIKQVRCLLIQGQVTQLIDKCSAEHLSTNVKLSEMWS